MDNKKAKEILKRQGRLVQSNRPCRHCRETKKKIEEANKP